MTMQEMLQFIASNGFAMVVATYCLLQNNKTVQENTEVLNKLCDLIDRICGKLGIVENK